jgi:ABC-2 type transport system ATP-binding protein
MTSWGLEHASVRYGRRLALDDVTLEVPAGAVTAVIGGDGAGKSTMLRTLAGVSRPASGTVRSPQRERLGYVSGASGLYTDLSVAENVDFVAAAYSVPAADLPGRRADLLAGAGLTGLEGRLAGKLSGGMQQKLAFALAMLHRPELLVLDEPTTGVDPVSRAELWRLIAEAAAGGAGVLVSTTYLDEARRAARVLLLDEGRAVATGTPEEVTAAAAAPEAGGGPAGAAPVTGTRASAALTSAPVAETRPSVAGASAAGRATHPLARAGHVIKQFGATVAVDHVDLAVHSGEVVGLLGANGAGKTTLLRLLLGLLRPTAGSVSLFGRPPSRGARLRLGYVPQGLGLWEDLSVQENLDFAARAFGRAAPDLEPDLEVHRGDLVRSLPQGLRRRLAFAAALAHTPELLVLDEPTSGVDPRARLALWDAIARAAEAGAGVLVTTHHLEEAGYCDRLVIMSGGRVVAEGTPAAIVGDRRAVEVGCARWEAAFAALQRAGLEAALVGRTLRVPGADTRRVRAALDAAGLVADVRVVPATLEETFVTLARTADGGRARDPERTTT